MAYLIAHNWPATPESMKKAREEIEAMDFTPEALTENLRSAIGKMLVITDAMVETAVRTYFSAWDIQDKFQFMHPNSNIVQVKMSMPAMRKALEAVLNPQVSYHTPDGQYLGDGPLGPDTLEARK